MNEGLVLFGGSMLTYFLYSQLRGMNLTWAQIAYIEFLYILVRIFTELAK